MKKLQLFDQNHALSPLQKCQFCLHFKSMFILSRKACFLTRTSPNTFSGFILHNTKRSKNFQFLTKTMDEPLWKNANFVGLWNGRFRRLERLVCYIKRRKSFSHHVFSRSMTWEYRGLLGLQGVTRDYSGLQRGCRGLQGVTRGDKRWHGVTKDYTNFFLTRTFPDTFSWSVFYKNQSWRHLQFLTKTMD